MVAFQIKIGSLSRKLNRANLEPVQNISKIADSTPDESDRAKILALAGKDFEKEIANKRCSPLDLLEEYRSAALPLGDFLAMLPPMRIRQYSISSSPLADPTTATVTWSVLDTPAKVGDSKRFLGVVSCPIA